MFTRIITSSLLFLIAIGGFVVSYDTGSVKVSQSYAALTDIQSAAANPNLADDRLQPALTKEQESTKDMYNKLVAGLNIALAAINVVVAPAIILASWLMSPDWTSGDAFGLREVMHKIWIVVSNIIYFVYAILLIMIALGTIFGRESFSYQKMLPKLALGILMVPFTWWFVQWTISLSTIVTASVLTIPQEAMKELNVGDGKSWWETPSIPKTIVYSPTETIATVKDNGGKPVNNSVSDCNKPSPDCISPKTFYEKGTGMWAPLVIYSYSIFKFQDAKELKDWKQGVSNILQLVHQGIFGVLMLLVFGLLVIALIFMLMVRAIKLWVYAIFSPLFTLHFVAGKEIMGKMGDGDDTFSIKEFIGLCFVPAIVGLTLSFGLIVLSMVITPPAPPGVATADTSKISLFGNANNSISIVEKDTLITLGDMKITYKGGLGGGGGVSTQSTLNSVFAKAGGFFGTIIIDIIALIFIWTAFMAAKNVNKAVGKAIEPFEKMGQSIGGLAASLPKYAPLPIPGGSISGAQKTIAMGQSAVEYSQNKKLEENGLYKALKEKAGNTTGAGDVHTVKNAALASDLTKVQEVLGKNNAKSATEITQQISPEGLTKLTEKFYGQNKDMLNKLIKIENKTEDDWYKITALLSGAKASNLNVTGKVEAEKFLNEKSKSTTTAKTGSTTTSGTTINMNLNNNSFSIPALQKDTTGKVSNAGEVASAITSKINKNTIKLDVLKESLKTAGIKDTADQQVIIDNLPGDFFRT